MKKKNTWVLILLAILIILLKTVCTIGIALIVLWLGNQVSKQYDDMEVVKWLVWLGAFYLYYQVINANTK